MFVRWAAMGDGDSLSAEAIGLAVGAAPDVIRRIAASTGRTLATDTNGTFRPLTATVPEEKKAPLDGPLPFPPAPPKPSPLNPPKKPTHTARQRVENFALEPHHLTWAAANAPDVNVEAELEAWRDHNRANGFRSTAGPVMNAQASFYNWLRRSQKWSKPHGRTGSGADAPAATPRRTAKDFGHKTIDDLVAEQGNLPGVPETTH